MPPIPVDDYVLDTLMRDLVGHDRQPAAYLVYLFLWRRTGGGERGGEAVSLREIAEGTGLSKRAVQDGLARLHRRRLIRIERAGITAVPEYTVCRPWVRAGESVVGGGGGAGEVPAAPGADRREGGA